MATILGQDSCLPLIGDLLPMQTLVNGSAMLASNAWIILSCISGLLESYFLDLS